MKNDPEIMRYYAGYIAACDLLAEKAVRRGDQEGYRDALQAAAMAVHVRALLVAELDASARAEA